ncbi:hypothetical protein [Moorena sp. SIO4A5]|nr:hypothetical protein [Moorena sp. SIO4A5]NEO20628.1 hypothetical protein [Moorena sp. SIO4A5]NEQ59065.1 hypothetical protein [Moorena sp. SIO4A1]
MSVSLFPGASGKYLEINKRKCINFFKAAKSLSVPCSGDPLFPSPLTKGG